MKTIQLLIFSLVISTLLIKCSSKKDEPILESKIENNSIDSIKFYEDGLRTYKEVGNELFNSILDTIKISRLNKDMLTQSSWHFIPFPECRSTLTFNSDKTGNHYECEIEENNSFQYELKDDTLKITEFHIPHVDNPEGNILKLRDDNYLLNNNSLILVGSTMYNNAGIPYEPKIEVIIEYVRIKN